MASFLKWFKPAETREERARRSRRIFNCILAVFGGGLVGLFGYGVLLIPGVFVSLRAEHAYGEAQGLIYVIERYVDRHAEWPTSWEDLEAFAGSEESEHVRAAWHWASRRRYIVVDYSVKLEALETQSVDEFVAIRSTGPVYSYDYELQRLLETIRRKFEEARRGASLPRQGRSSPTMQPPAPPVGVLRSLV